MPDRRLAAAAAVLALIVPVAGCSGDPEAAPTPEPSVSVPADPDSVTPTAPGGTQSPSTVPQEPTPEEQRSPGERPTRDEVRQGLRDYIAGEYGTGEAKATELSDCIVEQGYDDWTVNTLIAMVDGVPADVDENDLISVQRALRTCGVPVG